MAGRAAGDGEEFDAPGHETSWHREDRGYEGSDRESSARDESAREESAESNAADGSTGEAWADEGQDVSGLGQLDDLRSMHRDDALLDALGGRESASDVDEQELNELLLAWKQDLDSEPMPELVDTDTAVAAINTAKQARYRSKRARNRRAFTPVTVAAAVLAIAFAGTGLAARGAHPGDPLWGLTQVLYTDHAQSVQAADSARLSLDTADSALSRGRTSKAQAALESAAEAIRSVDPTSKQQQLRDTHSRLENELGPDRTQQDDEQDPQQTGQASDSETTESSRESSSGTSSTTSDSSETTTTSDDQESQEPTEGSQSPSPSESSSREPSTTESNSSASDQVSHGTMQEPQLGTSGP